MTPRILIVHDLPSKVSQLLSSLPNNWDILTSTSDSALEFLQSHSCIVNIIVYGRANSSVVRVIHELCPAAKIIVADTDSFSFPKSDLLTLGINTYLFTWTPSQITKAIEKFLQQTTEADQ